LELIEVGNSKISMMQEKGDKQSHPRPRDEERNKVESVTRQIEA
jgi:hypothetical protein